MAKTTKTDGALEALRTAIGAARTLTETEASLRAQHTALLEEKKNAERTYRAEAEIVADIDHLVDEKSAEWARDHGPGIVRSLNGDSELRGRPGAVTLRDVPARLPQFGAGPLQFSDLCGLQPAAMKRRLGEIVHQSGAKFGLPKAEREATLAALDSEISALEEQHQGLVDGAASVGIVLPLLDAVRQRRETEAAAAQRAKDLADQRARGEYVVGA